jgi:hypothetical protein
MKPKPFASLNHFTVPVAILHVPLRFERVAIAWRVRDCGKRPGRPEPEVLPPGRQTPAFYGLFSLSVKWVGRGAGVPLKKLLQSSNIDPT